jgi:phospholipid transport system substrate-binding protein
MQRIATLSRVAQIGIAGLTLALAAPGPAEAADPPGATKREERDTALEAFKAGHEAVIKLARRHASTGKLQAKVDGLLDYDWIAKTALGGADKYAETCGSQCAEFESLLKQLIRENYLRLVRKADKHDVEYVDQVRNRLGNAFKVKTKVKVDRNGRTQTVVIAYVMRQVGGLWQVQDIITDDVSLARTYKYEFNRIMRRGGIDSVIETLQSKLTELAAKK